MATGKINKPYAEDHYIKNLSISTGASDNGFHITYNASTSFTIFYFDTAGRIANIRKTGGASAIVTELHGTFTNTSTTTTDTYLNVGAYTRASFQIVSGALGDIAVSIY